MDPYTPRYIVPKVIPKPGVKKPPPQDQAEPAENTSPAKETPVTPGVKGKDVLTYDKLMLRLERSQESLEDRYLSPKDKRRKKEIAEIIEEGVQMAIAGVNHETNILSPDEIKKDVKETVDEINKKWDRRQERGDGFVSSDDAEGEEPYEDHNAPTRRAQKEEGRIVEPERSVVEKQERAIPDSATPAQAIEYLKKRRNDFLSTIKNNSSLAIEVAHLFDDAIEKIRSPKHWTSPTHILHETEVGFQHLLAQFPIRPARSSPSTPVARPMALSRDLRLLTDVGYTSRQDSPSTSALKRRGSFQTPVSLPKRANTSSFAPLPDLSTARSIEEGFYHGVQYATKEEESIVTPAMRPSLQRRIDTMKKFVRDELGLQITYSGAVVKVQNRPSTISGLRNTMKEGPSSIGKDDIEFDKSKNDRDLGSHAKVTDDRTDDRVSHGSRGIAVPNMTSGVDNHEVTGQTDSDNLQSVRAASTVADTHEADTDSVMGVADSNDEELGEAQPQEGLVKLEGMAEEGAEKMMM